MIYIEIDGTKYPCKIDSFHTQIGSPAVRITGAPLAENGFKIYNDDDMVADMSEYTYLYREEGTVKEYTTDAEDIIPAEGYISGIPESPIQKQFDSVNRRISDITPYEQSKKAYYGEVEKVFYGVPKGNLSVFMDGEYTIERIEDRVYVRFERLAETKDITIMIQ